MTRYVFDVTALREYMARHAQLTGIQRVSVMTIDQARRKIGAEHVWFGYHDRKTDTYKVLRGPTDKDLDLTQYLTLCGLLRIKPTLRALPRMEEYDKRPIERWFHARLRDFQAAIGNRKYFQRRGLSLQTWKATRVASETSYTNTKTHDRIDDVVQSGDRLVLLDNAWLPKGLEPWLKHAGTKLGLKVSVLLHDMIPLVTPHLVQGDTCRRFYDWLIRSTEYVTCYLANSENTGRDLREFLDVQNASQPVKVVPLAQSLVHIPSSVPEYNASTKEHYTAFTQGAHIPDHIRVFTKTPYVLVVGTMEVRKNLWQVATVWDRLRRKPGCSLPKIIFAGRQGWLNEDFNALMQATGQLGGWAEIVVGPSDEILDYLYRNCLFTITASFYEGWGLPIGESLAYGKTAVVSNTSSMPEVGGDMVEYCDPHDLGSIEAACLKLIDTPEHRIMLEERIFKTQLRRWDEVAHDMVNAVES